MRWMGHRGRSMAVAVWGVWALRCAGQTAPPAQEAKPAASDGLTPQTPAERHGQVLFQSHGDPPKQQGNPTSQAGPPTLPATKQDPGKAPAQEAAPDLTDRERESFTVTRYDLDLKLQPLTAGLTARAHLTLRNTGTEALRRVPLQISSSLHWEAAAELRPDGTRTPLPVAQHTLDTDADHTGKAAEGILTLGEPLAPGATVQLDVLYSGTISASTGRLQRIGVTAEQASGVDWDGIGAGEGGRATALRGFGNVLWYPVVSPQLFLGSGNELFRAIGAMRWRERAATVKLHLALDYTGEPPAAVYFCGRREPLKALSDGDDAPVATGTGVGLADFAEAPMGFRTMSLFVMERPEMLVAPLPSGQESITAEPAFSSSALGGSSATSVSGAATAPRTNRALAAGSGSTPGDSMLAVETGDEGSLPALIASAQNVAPLLIQWFGPRPLSALTLLDAAGQPFQDGPLLRAPLGTLSASTARGVLAHSLTSAWVQTGEPWMDEGLGEFMGLLWTEQASGRTAALSQLAELMTPVSLAEPAFPRPDAATEGTANVPAPASAEPRGEPLPEAQSELFYRRKAAAVWWMLRDIAGENALRQAVSAWRLQTPTGRENPQATAVAFEKLLERTSGKDLQWFFADWVLRDRGLPDLTLVDVTPRQLPAGQGHDSGWLVAVTVRNDGAAVADVPLVVRSGSFSNTKRLRVPGFGTVTERVLVEAAPTEVLLNDGSTPEVRASVHSRTIVTHGS